MFDPDTINGEEPEPPRKLWFSITVPFDVFWSFLRRFFSARAFLFCLVLGLPGSALGAVGEICGNGIDDSLQTGGAAAGTRGSCPAGFMDSVVGLGCDRKCPTPDQDDDGYSSDGSLGNAGTTNTDCDDTNKWIYPGVQIATGCTGSDYKTCQTGGTYTSCSAGPLAEGDTNKYISCTAGNDANAGTYASPYKTLGKVSGGSAGTTPASPYTLTANDFVYLIGGTCSDTFAAYGDTVVADLTASGSAGNPITIKQYPGTTAPISNANGSAFIISGSYYNLVGLDFTADANGGGGSSGAADGNGAYVTGDYVNFSRVYCHDQLGNGDNNASCIYASHTNGVAIDRSFFEDCHKDTGNVLNASCVKWLDDDDVAGECQDHSLTFSTLWMSTLDDTLSGACVRQKHGCDSQDVGANKHPIKWNSFVNCTNGILWDSSALRASYNQFANNQNWLQIEPSGESSPHQDNVATYNTAKAGGYLRWVPTYNETDESLALDHNMIQDEDASYVAGNWEGVIAIDGYGSDAQKTSFESPAHLTSNTNCFYNPNTALVFSYFSVASGGGGHGPAGNAGANYSFANWQGTVGQDAASFVEAPLFDDYLQPTSSNCTTVGRLYGSTTTTTIPAGTNPSRGKFRGRGQ